MSSFYVAPCSKCGEENPRIDYVDREIIALCYSYTTGAGRAISPHRGEHFHITCGRCGYRWAKAIDDPDPQPEPPYIGPADWGLSTDPRGRTTSP